MQRAILAVYVVAHVVTAFIIPRVEGLSDANVARLLQYSGYGGVLNSQSPIFFPIALLPLVAAVGLGLGKAWGRVMLVVATVVNLLSALLFGVSVSAPLGSFFAYITV
jgi:hypothetical protein